MLTKNTFRQNQGVKSDTFLDNLIGDSSELVKEINILIQLRKNFGYTQEEMSWACKVSLATIKRWESFKVDSLSLYLNYKHILT